MFCLQSLCGPGRQELNVVSLDDFPLTFRRTGFAHNTNDFSENATNKTALPIAVAVMGSSAKEIKQPN